MRTMRNIKEWFEGRKEIPSSVWYILATTMAAIYIASIITSIMTNN